MSVQAPASFNFGFYRRLMASTTLTPTGGNIRCPLCGGPTKGGVILHDDEPAGSLTATIHCRARHCFSTTQRIERIAP